MANPALLRDILAEEELSRQLQVIFGPLQDHWLAPETQSIREDSLLTGHVVAVSKDGVRVSVDFKSDAVIPLREWQNEAGVIVPPQIGDEVPVWVVTFENDEGAMVLSHRKARRLIHWKKFLREHDEGDTVSGRVVRQVRGGLLVDIGITAFLPASLVDIRRPTNLEDYVGKHIEAVILKVDRKRQNVILSRRKAFINIDPMPFTGRLADPTVGQVRKGVVKNIAEFGALVDLGGLDGLLHVADMAWGRGHNVHDFVRIDQELDVYILNVDRSKAKIALSLKHLTPSPWVNVGAKYPVGSRHQGEVVRLMSYGAFVRLEPGIEGLVHISELSKSRSIGHPAEVMNVGDRVDVQVLSVNEEKSEICLGE